MRKNTFESITAAKTAIRMKKKQNLTKSRLMLVMLQQVTIATSSTFLLLTT